MELLKISPKDKDAAQRISDTVALHLTAADDIHDVVGQWCAFHLDDGLTDGSLYPSKDDAIRYQKGDPKNYCYLKLTPDGITVNDAWHYLKTNRHPMIDTTAPEHVINPKLYPRFSNISKPEQRRLQRDITAMNDMNQNQRPHRG